MANLYDRPSGGLPGSGAMVAALFDLSSEAVVAVNSAQHIVGFSKGAERMFGYAFDDVVDKPLTILLPPAVSAKHHEFIEEFATAGTPTRLVGNRGEISGRRKNGDEFPAEASIAQLELEGERVFVAVLRDITDRKLGEAELERSRKARDLILSSAGEGIYGVDKEGLTTFVNPAAAAMLGWEPDEILGQPQHALSHHTRPDGSPYPREACPIYAAFKDGAVHRVEDEVFWRKDGSSFPVEYVSTPIHDADAGLVGAVVTFRDITERKAAEEDIEQSRRSREQILSSAGEGIYGLDREGKTTFVNPAAARMLGWDSAELLGKPQHQVIHHARPDGTAYPREECPIYAAFKDGAVHRVDDEVFWRKDGSSFPVEYVSTPMRDADGDLVGAVVTFRDITERKQSEETLHDTMAQLEVLKDRLAAESEYLQQEIKLNHNFEEIVGESAALQEVLHKVEQVAGMPTTVLILGETGTGKELFARAVHNLSDRRDRPLVKVNCAALPSTLIESELFGHEKGAFTGALAKKVGRFALADGGTIFLDEIGDLPLELQAKLLRVLQEGEFDPVGSTQTVRVDVRVIGATNRNLRKAVWGGSFRSDLYYRLNVFPVVIPPLRERKEDIPALAQLFMQRFGRSVGKVVTTIPDTVIRKLQSYEWPGNIRELQNVIERSIILTEGTMLRVEDALDGGELAGGGERAIGESLEDVEREHIQSVLEKTGWQIAGKRGAADRLQLNPSTLRSRIEKLGIRRPRS